MIVNIIFCTVLAFLAGAFVGAFTVFMAMCLTFVATDRYDTCKHNSMSKEDSSDESSNKISS